MTPAQIVCLVFAVINSLLAGLFASDKNYGGSLFYVGLVVIALMGGFV